MSDQQILSAVKKTAADAISIISLTPASKQEKAEAHGYIATALVKTTEDVKNTPSQNEKVKISTQSLQRIKVKACDIISNYVNNLHHRILKLKNSQFSNTISDGLNFIEQKLNRIASRVQTLNGGDWQQSDTPSDYNRVLTECKGMEILVDSFENQINNLSSWGNPRHHIISMIIGFTIGIVLIYLTPILT